MNIVPVHEFLEDFASNFLSTFHCCYTLFPDIISDRGTSYLRAENFQLLCAHGVFPLTSYNVKECNLGRVPANVIVTRQSESSVRKEDMRHLLLMAAENFGKPESFFRLFYNYFSKMIYFLVITPRS
nr:transferrin-like [Cherax quadricarinatus]